MLGGGVGRDVGRAGEARGGGDVHDAAPAARQHPGHEGAGEEERSRRVDREVALPERQIGPGERLGRREARVVDEDVDGHALGVEAIERGHGGLEVRHVQHAAGGLEAARRDDLAGHLAQGLDGAAGQQQAGPRAREGQGHRAADAPAGSGDERGPALERLSHVRVSSRAAGADVR